MRLLRQTAESCTESSLEHPVGSIAVGQENGEERIQAIEIAFSAIRAVVSMMYLRRTIRVRRNPLSPRKVHEVSVHVCIHAEQINL